LGYLPERKNPALAAEILKELIRKDPSGGWELHFAGLNPNQFSSLPSSPKVNMAYYEELNITSRSYNSLRGSPRIIFDPFTEDPGKTFFSCSWFCCSCSPLFFFLHIFPSPQAEWLRGIGFILSTSDSEGSHHAIAEGIASGCVALVKRWPGAVDVSLAFSSRLLILILHSSSLLLPLFLPIICSFFLLFFFFYSHFPFFPSQ
jgi:hypothetical protein